MNLTNNLTTSIFKNNIGQNIFYRNWKTNGRPKAIVLMVHGLNSHSAYFHQFALQLTESGFEVYAIDVRGRGHSQGERYFIKDYRDVVDDINKLVNIIEASHPAEPLFLMGHSAGGVFAAVYALLYQSRLRGLITESFAFQVPAPAFALATMKLLGWVTPHLRLIKLKNEDFSRDQQFVNTLNNDPLLKDEKQPARTMQQLLFASARLKQGMPSMQLPLLIIHGTADKATMPAGSRYFVDHAGSLDKQLKLYEGYYHDPLHDNGNAIVSQDIVDWLNERV